MVSALWAPAMLLSPSAVETLERNSPSGLLESAFAGDSFSTWARYVFASLVSPDLIAEIRLVSALSKAFVLLLEELETEDVEDAESSEKRELLLCKLEISMNRNPFRVDFSRLQLRWYYSCTCFRSFRSGPKGPDIWAILQGAEAPCSLRNQRSTVVVLMHRLPELPVWAAFLCAMRTMEGTKETGQSHKGTADEIRSEMEQLAAWRPLDDLDRQRACWEHLG